jgi:hypothetical protein
MSFVGVCLMLFGALMGVLAAGALYSGFATSGLAVAAAVGVALALAFVPAGWWTMSAGRNLTDLVQTRGQDLERLLAAVAQLRRLFSFARAVIIVFAALVVFAAGALVWCTFVLDRGGKCLGAW